MIHKVTRLQNMVQSVLASTRTGRSGSSTVIFPEVLDANGNWCYLLPLESGPLLVKIKSDGELCWDNRSARNGSEINDCLRRLLRPVPLPAKAKSVLPVTLIDRIAGADAVAHIASLSLWEALAKAIIRQVIGASHAKVLIRRFISAYGQPGSQEGSRYHVFPKPEYIIRLTVDELRQQGLGFKAEILQTVAREVISNGLEQEVAGRSADDALAILQRIPRIGPWTSKVALCDVRSDWSVYPFEDLAVRTWARKFWPSVSWPDESAAFEQRWARMTGEHVGVITFYLLTLGPLGDHNTFSIPIGTALTSAPYDSAKTFGRSFFT